jgi:molybdenum cofactor cytidylyltransferase
MESKISAILLAAGLSRRMGEDKLFLPYKGKTLLQQAVDLLSDLPVYEKIVVTTVARLERIALSPAIKAVINPQPEAGQSESLKLGIAAASGDLFFFMTADQPRLTATDLLPLLESARNNENKIIYPIINGDPYTPSLFSARFRMELLALTGDTGGRPVRMAHPEAHLTIAPEHPENFLDVDSAEDYETLWTRIK